MLMGTSLTFYRGPKFHDELLEKARRATGLPCSSMSQSVVDGLRFFGAKKVAVSTAYSKVVNDKLQELLEYHGFEVEVARMLRHHRFWRRRDRQERAGNH